MESPSNNGSPALSRPPPPRRLTRRDLARGFAAAAALFGPLAGSELLAASRTTPRSARRLAQNEDTFFYWRQIAANVRVGFRAGANVLVYSIDGEAVLVDAKTIGVGLTLREEIEARGERLVAVINTHHHPDHAGGNVAFRDVPVIAHSRGAERAVRSMDRLLESYREDPEEVIRRTTEFYRETALTPEGAERALRNLARLTESPDLLRPEPVAANTTFEDRHEIELRGRSIQILHPGRGHTDNDAVVWLADEFIMHTGDLVFPDTDPVIDASDGGNTVGWQRCLQEMIEISDPSSIMVHGHGALGLQDRLWRQNDYFDRLREAVGNAVAAGMTREDAVETLPTSDLPELQGMPRTTRFGVNVGIVYDELTR